MTKYSESLCGAYNVVPIREMILEIIKLALRKTSIASSLDEYKAAIFTYLQNEGFGEDEGVVI